MTNKFRFRCIVTLLCWICSPLAGAEILHQSLQVSLQPQAQSLQVSVQVSLPQGVAAHFLLHRGLNPGSSTPEVKLIETGQVDGPVPMTAYRVQLPEGRRSFSLRYGGRISHPLTRFQASPGLSQERLAGTISEQGVHLDAASGWYPLFADNLQTFSLEVELPDGWLAVSQGAGPELNRSGQSTRVAWRESQPQDEIYLIAAPFRLYRRALGQIEAQVFLRQEDDALAQRYLDASEHYLKLYQRLIGDYPYAKFALVENFWESGYGMPSFTLLGSKVIRLPFILHTSYPHEILHNWWGNSVYIDYAQGNWSEGLTTYLADHLLAEQRQRGSDYRRSALQRYGDFVRHDNDFPLREFRGRHSTASQAVGYDKSMMLFHMLRRELGDERFIAGLRRFYRDNCLRTAGYEQLQSAFEAVADVPLNAFFRQWVERTGAPTLTLDEIRLQETAAGYRLDVRLAQTQAADAYSLQVPLAIALADGSLRVERLRMSQRRQSLRIDLPAAPLSLNVDPWFDLFRTLDAAETPPSLSQFFGAERVLILLPAAAEKDLLEGYRSLAASWASDYQSAQIRLDSELQQLPADLPVLLLGWENRFRADFFDALSDYPVRQTDDGLRLWEQSFNSRTHSYALAARPAASQQSRLWIATRSPQSLSGLGRKLPHYGKYSALVFAGDVPENRMKRQWPLTGSPLQVSFSKQKAPLAPEPPPLTGD
jgi:hypothetical protein